MKIIELIIMLSLLNTLQANAEICQHAIKFGEVEFVLNKTNYEFVVEKYGYSERFNYNEYGSFASCYRVDDAFIFFGFQFIGDKGILKRVEASILPPTGRDESFCKTIPLRKEIFKVDEKYIGVNIAEKNNLHHFKKTEVIEINNNCHLTKEFIYFGDSVANFSVSLSGNF